MPPSEEDRCHQKAVSLLARRAHFRRELERKLRQRDFDSVTVQSVLERLDALGYLDDTATARGFVRERLARGPIGRRRLAAELARRGVDAGLAAEVLDESLSEDETPMARRAAEAWRRVHPDGDRDALARHLNRKGFPAAVIYALLDEIVDIW